MDWREQKLAMGSLNKGTGQGSLINKTNSEAARLVVVMNGYLVWYYPSLPTSISFEWFFFFVMYHL
jgi:hypothetical protein